MVRCQVVDEWDELDWYTKHLLIAYLRARDTMQAWEIHVQNEEIERASRSGHG
jgi:hypothetical protein